MRIQGRFEDEDTCRIRDILWDTTLYVYEILKHDSTHRLKQTLEQTVDAVGRERNLDLEVEVRVLEAVSSFLCDMRRVGLRLDDNQSP